MERDLITRFVKKDGTCRVSFYRDDCADNPRYSTDEPLHCEDWERRYTIMTKHDMEFKSNNARALLEYLIDEYGDYKKIIDALVSNGKEIGNKKVKFGTALVYDKCQKSWILIGDNNCYFGSEREDGWYEYAILDGKKNELSLGSILSESTDDAIEYFAEECMTDKVKMMSYNFGYYGELSFSEELSVEKEGICWLEKDEFLKYRGCNEDYWKGKTLIEIEWLIDELKSWSNGDVYGYVYEECVKAKIHKEYLNVNRDEETYEEEVWEEEDSCWGYYGELDKVEGWIFEEYGLNKEDFEEENV